MAEHDHDHDHDHDIDLDLAAIHGSTSSRRSLPSSVSGGSFRDLWTAQSDVFNRSARREHEEDEDRLRWAAIERLPTFERLRKGIVEQVLDGGRVVRSEVDVTKLRRSEKKMIIDGFLKLVEEDNEKFLRKLRDRIDR